MPEKEMTDDDLKNMSADEIAELQKQNCIFCKIANKEIPAKIIHEDADTICILDINPASEGHILVYPKKHYMIMPHMPDDVLAKVFKNVKLMSNTLLKSLQCKGTSIFIANGVAAGQKAPHVLIHVFPRKENDGLVKLPSYEMSDEQLSKLRRDLSPYLTQVFGRSKGEAEKGQRPAQKGEELPVKIKDDDDIEKRKTPDAGTGKNNTKTQTKKNEDAPKKAKGEKLDLDDIAKLFGG